MTVHLVFIEVEGAKDAFGAPKFDFVMKGQNVADLVTELMDEHGAASQKVFLRDGRYNDNLQIIVNWRAYVLPDKKSDFMLSEGDTVIFAPFVGGG
jgi:molybdopterin converting factor small subunit